MDTVNRIIVDVELQESCFLPRISPVFDFAFSLELSSLLIIQIAIKLNTKSLYFKRLFLAKIHIRHLIY